MGDYARVLHLTQEVSKLRQINAKLQERAEKAEKRVAELECVVGRIPEVEDAATAQLLQDLADVTDEHANNLDKEQGKSFDTGRMWQAATLRSVARALRKT